MADSCHMNITVTNPAGSEIAAFREVSAACTTGGSLKLMVAQSVGFPAAGMRLLLPSGVAIAREQTILEQLSSDMLKEGELVVSCVLMASQPFGVKWGGEALELRQRRSFRSKAGGFMERRITTAEKVGQPIVSTLRTPDARLNGEVRDLIAASFAPGVGPLIKAAWEAAQLRPPCTHQDVPANASPDPSQYVFEDAEQGTYADLSTCQLWTRALDMDAIDCQMMIVVPEQGRIVAGVLWRLLFNFKGSAEGPVSAGPVLEVLFLATSPEYRIEGEALTLVKELEDAARGLGCVAMCVAAVPQQGESFWKKSGFAVAVPLIEPADADVDGPASSQVSAIQKQEGGLGLGEPLTALGEFLAANMLLFSDTPLVAKVLT